MNNMSLCRSMDLVLNRYSPSNEEHAGERFKTELAAHIIDVIFKRPCHSYICSFKYVLVNTTSFDIGIAEPAYREIKRNHREIFT